MPQHEDEVSSSALPLHPETVRFREMLEQRIEARAPPLTAVPEEYKSLIVKLSHERYTL